MTTPVKIITAEEFFEQGGTYPELAIEFAKMHVRAALEAASKNVVIVHVPNCDNHMPYMGTCGNCGSYHNYDVPINTVEKDSILTAYPENLIQ